MADGKLKMVVEKRFKLEQAREAVVELQKRRAKGKIVVEVAGERNSAMKRWLDCLWDGSPPDVGQWQSAKH